MKMFEKLMNYLPVVGGVNAHYKHLQDTSSPESSQ